MSYYYKYNFVSPEPVYSTVKEELKSFYAAITQNVSPKVTVEDGCAAMEVAIEIIEKLKQNQIHF